MKKVLLIVVLLILIFPALYSQNIDYLGKAREFLAQGDCERAEYAYRDYKKVNPKGNAEIEVAIRKCKEDKGIVGENSQGQIEQSKPKEEEKPKVNVTIEEIGFDCWSTMRSGDYHEVKPRNR